VLESKHYLDLMCLSLSFFFNCSFFIAYPWRHNVLQGPTVSALDSTECDHERTIVISGVSKSFSMTGWRVGWMRSTPRVAAVAQKLQEAFVSCGVPFAQRGALAAVQGPREVIDDMVAACVVPPT
jgi:aspartate/methionine/tyrosine aminotransferase